MLVATHLPRESISFRFYVFGGRDDYIPRINVQSYTGGHNFFID